MPSKNRFVAGVHAPPPRPTRTAALCVAGLLCALWLALIAAWRLAVFLLG